MAPSLWLATSTRGSIFLSRFGGFRGLTLSWATPHEGNKSRKCRGSFLLYKFYLKRIGNRAIFRESWGTPHGASLGPSKELAAFADLRKSLFKKATHRETRCFGIIFWHQARFSKARQRKTRCSRVIFGSRPLAGHEHSRVHFPKSLWGL